MPCNCDHLEPTRREADLHRAARLLAYALKRLDRDLPPWLEKAVDDIYPSDERAETELCGLLRGLPKPMFDFVVYDARRAESRQLADWWETHQAADVAREGRERYERNRNKLRASALRKLTLDERNALGIESDD